ncbi:MAG: PIN domain-containing protein [Pseudonocardia sp.]
MRSRIVLDAAAFDVIDGPGGRKLRALLEIALGRDAEVRCAAVTLAEVCRGTARTGWVEAALARSRGGSRIRVVPTDERVAKLVGAILHDSASGSELLAVAHVVAVCAGVDNAAVITADPDDILRLATAVRGVRILTRSP